MCRFLKTATGPALHKMNELSAQKTLGTNANLPAHELVYRKIRDKVLFGELSPGQAVTIQGLVEEIGVSMTPVREAIRKLTAEGALVFQGNRRVCVPQMDARSFSELVFARRALEPQLARMSVENITQEGIDALRLIDVSVNEAIDAGNVRDYMYQNYRFHFTLYGYADSKILEPLVETLWLRYGPLYRIICGKWGTGNMVDLHEETLIALADGNADAVGEAIQQDIEQGFDIVRSSFDWE